MNFWATEKYKLSLESSWKRLFNENVLESVDWNYYHQKPETNLKHGMSVKTFNNNDILYTVEKVLKSVMQW